MRLLDRFRRPDCHRVRRVLQAYLDGELDERHASMVAAHLAECERCGIEAELQQRVKDSLAQLRPAPDPDALDRLHRFADSVPRPGADDPDDVG